MGGHVSVDRRCEIGPPGVADTADCDGGSHSFDDVQKALDLRKELVATHDGDPVDGRSIEIERPFLSFVITFESDVAGDHKA